MSLSRLSALPAEIRNAIYEYVVTTEQAVTFRLDAFQQEYYAPAVQPALTRVSRKVRAESLPLYYECNEFVLHTESPKAEDAWKWLRSNHMYLPIMRRLTLWIRYVPFADPRASSQGAIGISIYRPTRADTWRIDADWKWITVMRRPAELNGDVKYIMKRLDEALAPISKDGAGPEDYIGMMGHVRLFYVQEKMS
ncbi:hypothetical protein AC579_3522 [Pseudocercospora musae]|uniref:Uncharacterized protein n=1 Tax=Pseudocercospora musae TaxID=113226 RepID=A0A139IWG2_9PEZI|nr:hypothetical protein AC579_3522 [Pseudocercospora musae]